MKATELNLERNGYNSTCITKKSGSHYKFLMRLGRVFPSTKAQAKHFVSQQVSLDALNMDDVETIETLLNKHSMEGSYRYTKSKIWVRLQNYNDLYDALKLEFNL